MICEIDGLVLRGVQFGVLFEVLMAVRAHLFKIDGRVLGGMQFGVLVQVLRDAVRGELFDVLVTVRANFCDIDARVVSGTRVTVQAHVCILTVGCKGACSLGGGWDSVWGAG